MCSAVLLMHLHAYTAAANADANTNNSTERMHAGMHVPNSVIPSCRPLRNFAARCYRCTDAIQNHTQQPLGYCSNKLRILAGTNMTLSHDFETHLNCGGVTHL
jgi:hypothetical protein